MNTMPAFIAPKPTGGTTKKLAPDSYPARCYQMIMLGTHTEAGFDGKETTKFKIWLGWEFPTELDTFSEDKGEQPYTMGKEFPFSMHEKSNLRKTLESWRGQKLTESEAENFNLNVLLGAPCQINVVSYTKKNGEEGVKIDSVSKLMKGIVCPSAINKPQIFSVYDPDWGVFDTLPGFLQEKIKKSPEYLEAINPKATSAESDQSLVDNLFDKQGDDTPPPF